MSRRPRKTNHGITDFEVLLKAIKEVKVDKKPIKTTARLYDIPHSSFARYVQKFDVRIPDITQLNDTELAKVVKEIASYAAPSLV